MVQKIKNNGDWYLAEVIERAEQKRMKNNSPNRRCTTWINSILIKANSPGEAYDKALKIGRKDYETSYRTVAGNDIEWKVIGLANLISIFEDIEDGAEVSWRSIGNISAKRGNELVKSKKELVDEISR